MSHETKRRRATRRRPVGAATSTDHDPSDDRLPLCAGVPFATVVSVHVAVASGLALEAALAAHGLDLARWADADEAFADRLTEAVEHDGELVDVHDRLFAQLRDARQTLRSPAAESAEAFFALLREVGAATDPAGFLAAHGLAPDELARLGRRWTEGLDDPLAALRAGDAFVNGTAPSAQARRGGPVVALDGGGGDAAAAEDAGADVVDLHGEAGAPARSGARGSR